MKFFDAFLRTFDFEGRSDRSEYWLYHVFYFSGIFIFALIDSTSILVVLFIVANAITNISVFVRRCHDSNHSGFWIFSTAIPFLGIVALFIFTLWEGDHEANKYGRPYHRKSSG